MSGAKVAKNRKPPIERNKILLITPKWSTNTLMTYAQELPLTLEAVEEGDERDVAIRKAELLAQARARDIDTTRALMRDIGNLLSREVHMYKRAEFTLILREVGELLE